mgnify:CR=1 FL=1
MQVVETFPKGITRCLRPSLADGHVYVGGSGGSIAVVSTQSWTVVHSYSCLPAAKQPSPSASSAGGTDVLGNPSKQRAASAGRVR